MASRASTRCSVVVSSDASFTTASICACTASTSTAGASAPAWAVLILVSRLLREARSAENRSSATCSWVSARVAFSPSMVSSRSLTAASSSLTRPSEAPAAASSSAMRASVSSAAASSSLTRALAASKSPCSCSALAWPASSSPESRSAVACASSSWPPISSSSALAASRSDCSVAAFSCSCVSWVIVADRDSLLAFSLLLNSSMAMMAATSRTSSTICQILLLVFITRPP